MGKDLKGKELGTGLRQLRNGQYDARFTTKGGNRSEKTFDSLREARSWLRASKEKDENGGSLSGDTITVDQWFSRWMKTFMKNKLERSTYELYEFLYNKNISPVIGKILMEDIKPYHCQLVVNEMTSKGYSPSYVRKTASVAKCLFLSATENDVIVKSPYVSTISLPKLVTKETDYLTLEMVNQFLDPIKTRCEYALQFRLVLETGLRAGELEALTFDAIDFENGVIHVKQSLHYLQSSGFYVGNCKTDSSNRDIPMSDEAREILKEAIDRRNTRKKVLPEWADFIFTSRQGKPIHTHLYDKSLYNIATKRMHVKPFSMHDLRRTFSTLCYNAGCKDKDIAMIMGHSNVQTTYKHYIKTDIKNAKIAINKLSEYKKIGDELAITGRMTDKL